MQAASFKEEEAMHVIYTACGDHAKGNVLVSVKTLWLFASLSLSRGWHYYHIHVLTDGAMTPADLSFLQPSSHFKASIHPLNPTSAHLFRLCSSERLYMHEHVELTHVDKVTPCDILPCSTLPLPVTASGHLALHVAISSPLP